MKILMIVENTRTGYSAYAKNYPVFTTGKSLNELKLNILQALSLRLNKMGKKITEKDLKITWDLPK